ncbi:MAG: hypothetical protein ABR951_01125 [Candidatus Aminicenantales bacterium]
MNTRPSSPRPGRSAFCIAVALILLAVPTLRADERSPIFRAYPDRISPDLTFEAVVAGQPFPPVKYPVPVIGWKEHPEEIHVAPNGALVFPKTPLPGGLYLLPLLQLGSTAGPELLDPDSVVQELVDGYLPGVRSGWKLGGFQVRELAFATLLEGPTVRTGREMLVAVARWTVKNESGREQAVRLAFRIGEAVSGQSLFKTPPAYPAPLAFKRPFMVETGGRILIRVSASRVTVALQPSLQAGKALSTFPPGTDLTIDFRLRPGEERPIDLFIPYVPAGVEKTGDIERLAAEPQLEIFRDFWTRELNRRAQFIVPEKRVRDSYRAALAYSMILVDRDPHGYSLPHSDATAYEHVWAGDSACVIHAADRLGYHQDAAAYLDYFLSRQGRRAPEGDVSSADGFFSGDVPGLCWVGDNGFILWALAEHYKLTGDKVWLRKVAPKMIKSCDWIIRERARTKATSSGERPRHYGLLPKGRASDNAELNYFYWTDTYSYGGLRGTADVLPEIGMDREAARLRAEADDYKACILESVARSVLRDTDPPFFPQGPYMNQPPTAERLAASWYSLCSPISMVEMGLFPAGDPKAAWVNRTIEKYVMTSGLPTLVRPGYIDPHYVYNQALTQLLRGEAEKFLWTFYSVFAYGQSRTTYATLECNDIVSGSSGDAWDSLRMPHLHSNSRVLALLRIALVLEDGDALHLLAGTPRDWLEPGKAVDVRRAPTLFGDVDVRSESRSSGKEIVITIDPPHRKPARVILHVRPPSRFGAPESVTVDGRARSDFKGETIDLGRIASPTVIVCRYR